MKTSVADKPDGAGEIKNKNIFGSFKGFFADIFAPKSKNGLKESIEEILQGNTATSEDLHEQEKVFIRNVLEFKELYVEDVMVPRSDIFAIPEDISFEELEKKMFEKTYTRIPVFGDGLDEITGFLHIKDIAKIYFGKTEFNLKKIVRKCLFVPPSMKITNLLIRMQQAKLHMAIVVDEYGGTEGLVTLEDIIEEIVGKIEDEHDNGVMVKHKITEIKTNVFEASARAEVEELEQKLGIVFEIEESEEDEDFDTVGGLLYYIAGHIPVKGEIVKYNESVEFEVVEADARRVKKVLVRKI